MIRSRKLFAASLGLLASVAQAEPPHVSYIYPAGAQRGTAVSFKVGGHYLHDAAAFSIDGPGVTASQTIKPTRTTYFEGPVIPQPDSQRSEDYPVDYVGSLKVTPDAPLGAREWSVQVAQGVTMPMKFVIGQLPEVCEIDVDGKPLPAKVDLPITINGRFFPREDVDLWSFDLAAGQTVTCAVLAAGIGSPAEAHLEAMGPDGTRVGSATAANGVDPVLRFTAKETGRHVLKMNDASFGGLQHHVYRLTLTTGPYVDSVFPLGGRRGETLKVEVAGSGLNRNVVEVPIAANSPERLSWSPDFAVAPGLGFPLEIGDLPEAIESQANDSVETAQGATVPGVLNGRIETAGDVDYWKLEAQKGQSWLLEIHATDLGSSLDSVLSVVNQNGQMIIESDDTGSDPDSKLTFNPTADGTYFVRVMDRVASRGGRDFGYRLHVLDAKAIDAAPFTLEVQSSRVATVDRGGELKLKVSVKRSNFNDPIELSIDGLPAGIALSDTTIPAKQNNATLTLKADAAAALNAGAIQVIGSAKVGESMRRAIATVRTNPPTKEPLDTIRLAVTVKTPFKFTADFESKFAPRGSAYARRYRIERGGFDGPIEVSLADRQTRHLQGVKGSKMVVPPGVTDFEYVVSLPPWLEVGRTSRTCIMLVGEVADADGKKHKVCFTSKEQNDQIIVLTAPEEFSSVPEVASVRAIPGQSIAVPLQVGRASGLVQPATIEIVPCAHMRGITAEKVTVPADIQKTFLTLKFDNGPIGPFNAPLTIRSTTLDVRGLPVVHECSIEIVTDAPAPEVEQFEKTALAKE